ncbi:hypothetical protein ACLKA7_001508 [Drosophila subpalustris]
MVRPSTRANAAKMERPVTNPPQVARMCHPLYGRLPMKSGKGARSEDLVAFWAKVSTAGGEQEAVLVSAYFSGDSNDAPPREISGVLAAEPHPLDHWLRRERPPHSLGKYKC